MSSQPKRNRLDGTASLTTASCFRFELRDVSNGGGCELGLQEESGNRRQSQARRAAKAGQDGPQAHGYPLSLK